MNRVFFSYEQLIAELAKCRGYTPFLEIVTGEASLAPSPNIAIIRPSTIDEWAGGERSRISSILTLYLFRNAAKIGQAGRSNLWREIKCDALEIVCEVGNNLHVLSISDVEITPCSRKEGKGEEVGLKICLTVDSNYDTRFRSIQMV